MKKKEIDKYRVDLPLKISTNQIYSGVHWTVRNNHKNIYRNNLVYLFKMIPPPKVPFILNIDFYFKKNVLDCSNCSYLAKLLEDCLIHAGLIADDNPKVIKKICLSSNKTKEEDYFKMYFTYN